MFSSARLIVVALSAASVVLAQGPSSSGSGPAAPPASSTPAPPAASTTPPPTPAGPPSQSTYPATPLASKRFPSPSGLPYKVDTDVGLIRGNQHGYNICNSTTENQSSLCQTSYFNSLDDFCLWGPPEYGREVGDIEGIMIAWCTKPGHGTRLIPQGALKGVQFTKTPDYVQAVGFIDQTFINILAGDWGGEMDPHGADLRGNPMGGIIFSNAYTGQYQQVVEWHNFVGGNTFCLKACDPAGPNAAHFCEHIFDRIGCQYNAPSNAVNGTFESCLGDNQDFPGVYTSDGQVVTYTQPAESLGPITTIPYTARIPASSSCTTFESASLYTGLPSVAGPNAPSATPTGSSSRVSTTGSTRAGGSSGTGTAGSAQQTDASGAPQTMVISGLAVLGVVFSAVFFG